MEKAMKQRQTPKLNEAIVFVTQAYDGYTLKGTEVPYVLFLIEGAMIAATITTDEDVLAATVLHEVLADEKMSEADLRAGYGDRIADIVVNITRSHVAYSTSPDLSVNERRLKVIQYLAQEATYEEKIVVLADHLTLIRVLASDYEKLGNRIWFRYDEADKEKHAHYFYDIRMALAEFKNEPAGRELRDLIRLIFKEELIKLKAAYKREFKERLKATKTKDPDDRKRVDRAMKRIKKRKDAEKQISAPPAVKKAKKASKGKK